MTESEIREKIIERSADIAKLIAKGKDCEIRKDRVNGIKVISVKKEAI